MDLKDKVAIVTGGAVRLGREISLALAREGVKVVVHFGHSSADADSLVDEIETLGVEASAVEADFLQAADAAHTVVQHAKQRFGHIDFLINNAGIFEPGSLAETTEEQLDRHIAINLKAPLFLTRAFVEHLRAEARAHVVNIGDWRATRIPAGHLAYTLSKSGLVSLTKMLAQELAPNIQVNCICPGAILPPVGVDSSVVEQLSKRNPLGRMGSPADVTQTLIYLLRSDFVTGEVIHVTGGEQL